MVTTGNLGFPRIGLKRELKKAVESYWAGKISAEELEACARTARESGWQMQQAAGIHQIPTGDFSYYDHVLDMAEALGATPARYCHIESGIDRYFAMARGSAELRAMEMTKWFDSNYHYIVPELEPDTRFRLNSSKILGEFLEAKTLGVNARPVLLGPLSFLLLSKTTDPSLHVLDYLSRLLPVYKELLAQLSDAGAEWVQIDEPYLVTELDERTLHAYREAYAQISAAKRPKILVATYFEALPISSLAIVKDMPIDGLHIDLVRGRANLEAVSQAVPHHMLLSLGIIDGRNVWRTNLSEQLELLEPVIAERGPQHVQLAPSCSLLLSPYDLELESKLKPEIKAWMAFAKQKLEELRLLSTALSEGRGVVQEQLAANAAAIKSRRSSPLIHNDRVQDAMSSITPDMLQRQQPFAKRRETQASTFHLPPLPTTTIGSYPQTERVRKERARFRRKEINREHYNEFLRQEIQRCLKFQEEIGLDVLVHGEFERNDMVEYFGEQLEGFAFTEHGWVQSFGTRLVKPPIIYGDVCRRGPMTVEWSTFAQGCTKLPVKGMLTGPVTILQWSFVRDDQARETTCRQIALAIREEVMDLEEAGIAMIQIDEPAFREALPLQHTKWEHYLGWAVGCFRLASAGVKDSTQIHTHMCYSEFNDIIEHIAALDADVISIESSRSRMELLDAFVSFDYPANIGPGVYDIHSPRVPSTKEMRELLSCAAERLDRKQLWVNPDCGLKTRDWQEIEAALGNMVEAARSLRKAES